LQTQVLQTIAQILLAIGNELTSIHNALLTWMISFSSQVSHNIFIFVQTYVYQFGMGTPVATPRPLSEARSQMVRFHRTMLNLTACRIRNWVRTHLAGKKVSATDQCRRRN